MASTNLADRKSKRKDARAPSTLFGYDDEVDGGDVFSAEQQELLDLIERQDVNEVEEFFARGPPFDVSRGEIGRVALRLAIYNERADIAEILLENGVKIGNALFSAVIEGSKECVELFLDKRFFSRTGGDIGPTDRREGFFVSPLMLAVRLKDHDIIKYMVANGFKIDHPEDYQVENQPRSESKEQMQFLLHVNSYRALANPLYMGYYYLYNPESEHPLFTAFTMNKTLDRKATIDFEFKKDYKELSEGCEEFAVSLLEQCRTIDEIKILTDVRPDTVARELCRSERHDIEFHADTEEAKELAFLNMALRNNNNKVGMNNFVIQLRLREVSILERCLCGEVDCTAALT